VPNSNLSAMKISIYIAKIILHHNSKNTARVLAVIVNCEMCTVDCNIYIIKEIG